MQRWIQSYPIYLFTFSSIKVVWYQALSLLRYLCNSAAFMKTFYENSIHKIAAKKKETLGMTLPLDKVR